MPQNKKETAIQGWHEEKNSAFLYQHLAKIEQGSPLETLFLNLALAAEKQANLWLKDLSQPDINSLQYKTNFRTKIVVWLITIFGPKAIKPILASMKVRGLSAYLGYLAGHAPIESSFNLTKEKQHQSIGNGNNLRAAVFGVNDGLISNACLILGVAGSTTELNIILLSGIAGLSAGALSMAAGEYVSVRSQRELFEYQIGLEHAELIQYPEEEAAELSMIYQARGLSKIDADLLSAKMLENKEHALDTLAREELGLNPDELGSPSKAALFSFLAFASGGAIPLIPFLANLGNYALYTAILFTGVSLFAVGATLSLFTGRNALYSGLRMLLIGGFAGLTTNLIGHLVAQFGVKIN